MKGRVQQESAWKSRMRYAKIGAAAVGGGALLAVTGMCSVLRNFKDSLALDDETAELHCQDIGGATSTACSALDS